MIGTLIDERYEIVEFIGKGGMALVYRAIDKRTGHDVAVKILRPEFLEDKEFLDRFNREAVAVSKMSHHNIVNLLDVGQSGNLRYIVMEYVRGKTLKEVIAERGALQYDVAAQISIRILSALQHAHVNGIIHRDIKPQNILVHSEGHIKVADFGIARVAGSHTITKQDTVMGSAHYISPEQARGDAIAYTSDIYSVGVVLYEMLTGKVPFDGDTPVAVALQHINATPQPISEINHAIPMVMEKIVNKAMEKEPANRYQSSLEMAQDLQRAIHDPDGSWLDKESDKPIEAFVQDEPKRKTKDKPKRQLIKENSTTVRAPMRWQYNLVMLLFSIAAVLLIALFIVIFIKNFTGSSRINVPYVIDLTLEDAQSKIRTAGLKYDPPKYLTSDKPIGTVTAQEPENGTIDRNERVTMWISTGPDPQIVPDLIVEGMDIQKAEAEATRYGYKLQVAGTMISDLPFGTILTQTPNAGTESLKRNPITVYVSGGRKTLPDLINANTDEALRYLNEFGISNEYIRVNSFITSDAALSGTLYMVQYFEESVNVESGDRTRGNLLESGADVKLETDEKIHVYVELYQYLYETTEENGGA